MRFPPRFAFAAFLVGAFALAAGTASFAGIGGLTDKLKKNPLSSALAGKPPITTSLSDAKFADESRDNVDPAPFTSLLTLERTPTGGFVLQPGKYEMHTQSYCLKAGTHGPGGGDGYLYAPTMGPAEEAVVHIVRNSVAKPDIAQRRVQTLLWAIIARAKFEDLAPDHKATAAQLLTPKQLAELNRSALQMAGPALQKALDEAPAGLRQVLEAEAKLRAALVSPTATFEEMEAIAVLSGIAPRGEGSRDVPSGRWSKHPDGYFVRYLPRGYSHTVLQLEVPAEAAGKEFDPALHIAVPGNTARQRLIQSGRQHPSAD